MMKKQEQQIVIYKSKQGKLEVKVQTETVWLTLMQMAQLFGRDKSVISRHIAGVYDDKELARKATVAKYATVQTEGGRTTNRNLEYYNLDVIISVGYRVKSKQGVQFRIWASKVLNDYLVKGFAVNEKRLQEKTQQIEELKKVIQLQEKVFSAHALQQGEAEGLLKVIAEYMQALDILDDYDHQRLQLPKKQSKEVHRITYSEAKKAIHKLGEQTAASGLFGREKDDSFKGSLENIYQTFDGKDLYPSLEEKAAHLLYFVIKNHSFTDGNKRIAAFLFVWFLDLNKHLFDESGKKRLADNALVALTLMIAESDSGDKDMMIKVVVNLIHRRQ
jgi:prophage maintenance system killer protein